MTKRRSSERARKKVICEGIELTRDQFNLLYPPGTTCLAHVEELENGHLFLTTSWMMESLEGR